MSFLEIENWILDNVSRQCGLFLFCVFEVTIGAVLISNQRLVWKKSGWWAYRRYARRSDRRLSVYREMKLNRSVTTGRWPSYFHDNKNDNFDGELMRELHEGPLSQCWRGGRQWRPRYRLAVLMTLPDIQLSDSWESDNRHNKQYRVVVECDSEPNLVMKNLKKDGTKRKQEKQKVEKHKTKRKLWQVKATHQFYQIMRPNSLLLLLHFVFFFFWLLLLLFQFPFLVFLVMVPIIVSMHQVIEPFF